MVVQVRRRVFRAASVPVDYDDEVELESLTDPSVSAQRARMISTAIDNSDALTLASRRHDQQLLNDINSRIASATSGLPMQPSGFTMRRTVFRPVSYPARPPPGLPTSPMTSPSFTSSTMMSSNMTSSSADDDLEQIMPMTSRYLRAGSVPPLSSRGQPLSEASSGRTVVRERFSLNDPSFSWTPDRRSVSRTEQRVSLKASESNEEEDPYSAAATRARYLSEIKKNPTLDIDSAYSKLVSSLSTPDSTSTRYSSSLTPTAELAIREAHRNLDRIEHEIKTDTHCTIKPSSTSIGGVTRTKYSSLLDGDPSAYQNSAFVGPLTNLLTRSSSPGLYSHSNSETTLPFLRRYLSSNVQAPEPQTSSVSYKMMQGGGGKISTPLNVSTQFNHMNQSDGTTKMNLTSPLDLTSKYSFSLPLDIATKYNLTTTLDDMSASYRPTRKAPANVDFSASYVPVRKTAFERSISLEPQVSNKTRTQTINIESRNYPTLTTYKTRTYTDVPSGSSGTLTSVEKPFKSTRQTAESSSDDLEALIRSARMLPEVSSTYQRKSTSTSGRVSAPPASTSLPAGLMPLEKPQISDTRRRVRDVLCKVKGDPKYFD